MELSVVPKSKNLHRLEYMFSNATAATAARAYSMISPVNIQRLKLFLLILAILSLLIGGGAPEAGGNFRG